MVTDTTRRLLNYRRTVKAWQKDGFEQVPENGGKLWEIHRGSRCGQIIQEVRIAPDGMSLFVKIGKP